MKRTFIFFAFYLAAFLFSCSWADAQNITRPNIIGPMGVRVNTYTGSLFYQRNDLTIPGRGFPLDISFSYNSADRNKNMGFGKGWVFNYGMRYQLDSGNVVIIRNDGRKDKFMFEGNAYISPKGIFDQLESTGPGLFKLTSKEGIKYFFGNAAHRRITRMEDPNSNALTFGYTDTLLTSVTDASSRTLSLIWINGQLSSITDANGSPIRVIKYNYDNSGRLVKVINPLGDSTSYTYLANGPLSSIKDKNGNVVEIVYNNTRAVSEIITCLTHQRLTYNRSSLSTYLTEEVGSGNQVTIYRFDTLGNLVKKAGNCCGYNVSYEYDQDKNVSTMTDANGNPYKYTYDGKGNLLTEKDPLNHITTYTYEPNFNRISSVTDKNGNITKYTYDQRGNLIKVSKPLGITESYTYAANGDKLSYTDARKNKTTYAYNTNGYLTAIHLPLNVNYTYSYDTKGNTAKVTDARGNPTTFAYDALNRMLSQKDALKHTAFYTYDKNGNVVKALDKNGHQTLYTYDPLDRLAMVTDALNHNTITVYDAQSNILQVTDPNNNSIKYAYDNLNRMISKANGAGEIISYSYDGNGNIVSMAYPNGNNVTIAYDASNRIIGMSDVIGVISKYSYDNNGNKLTEADGNGNTTTYAYDAMNRLTAITDALGHSYEYTFDSSSNRTSVKDRNGHVTNYTYDALNRQATTIDALNYVTKFAYDAEGNLASVTDANNHTTSYTYDSLNRNTFQTYADGTKKSYTYDGIGNILSKLDGNGVTTKYSYDAVNRLLKRDYPGTNDDVFTFDNGGRMLTAINTNATVSFTYDSANRLTSEKLNGKTTGYQYKASEKKKLITYPGGRIIEEDIDERNRLIAVKDEIKQVANFIYDQANRNTGIKYINGVITNISFDEANRIISMITEPNGLQNFSYVYNNEGNKLHEKKLHDQDQSEQYSYDNLNRLVGFKRGTLVGTNIPSILLQAQYSYDAVGNRSSVDINGSITNYTTNQVNIYTKIADKSSIILNYDKNWNLIFDGVYNYTYDFKNRLDAVNSGLIAKYKYDALGRRLTKINGLFSINYFYAGNRVIEERTALDSIIASYTYGAGLDQILTMNRMGTYFAYHYNQLGSISAISNNSANIIERYNYDAFGGVSIIDSNHNLITNSSIGNTFLFTGRQINFETGDYYYRNRDYNSKLGRFKQKDPLGFAGNSMNLFAYVSNNPVNFVDPYGLRQISCTDEDKFDELDPSTLGKNFFGYNYPGPFNPKTYGGTDYFHGGPSGIPLSPIEIPGYIHDLQYGELGIAGASGLFFDTRAIIADQQFVSAELEAAKYYRSIGDYSTARKAEILAYGLGAASTPKTIYSYLTNVPVNVYNAINNGIIEWMSQGK